MRWKIAGAAIILALALTSGLSSVSLVVPAGDPPARDDSLAVLDIQPERDSGLLAYRIHHPERLQGVLRVTYPWNADAYNPLHVLFVHPNGSSTSALMGFDINVSQKAGSPENVYLGVGGTNVHDGGRPPKGEPFENKFGWEVGFDTDTTLLVLMWAHRQGDLAASVEWAHGTTWTLEADVEVVAHEMKDFRGGLRAHVPRATVHVEDEASAPVIGQQLFGYVAYITTGDGIGRATIEGDERHEIDLTHLPRAACARWGQTLFTSSSDTRVTLTYSAVRAMAYVSFVYAIVPPNLFPPLAWNHDAHVSC